MEYFGMSTKICMGMDSLKELESIDAGQVFIICDPFMNHSGKINLITDILKKREIAYKVFDKIVPDPGIELVAQAVGELMDTTDTVIALGGGSAIDAAKVVRKIFEVSKNKKVQFIAIPTTSGTGSELTSFAVVSDEETQTKIPLVDDSLLPDLAILDCEFTMSVPASVTADTGLDVLTHALEALASTKANDFTDAYAIRAIMLVFQYLKRVVDNGNDREARMHMHNASAMAGIAFNQTSLGICHSLAHALGGRFHIPHGRSNAMLLPHVMEYNTYLDLDNKETIKRYAELARALGFGTYNDIMSVKALVRQVTKLIKSVNIPAYLDDMVDIKEYKNAIEDMAKNALADKCTITNPKQPSLKDLEKIYKNLVKQKI
ncbi:iron-containing alcohol dehydrogenase [Clostridiales bacterium COT073_COT-073]|nr:iron-containing alcohol dehydrogenase [Clostridiales bacterium COT073_COT-073]